MQTIKSAIVVALLLTVCYGAFKAMNAPDVEMPEDLKTWADQNGKDVLPNFEIPAITSNDSFTLPDASASSNANSLPSFPSVDLPPANLVGNSSAANSGLNAGSTNPSLTPPTLDLPALPPMTSSLSAAPDMSSSLNSNPTFPSDSVPSLGSAPKLTSTLGNGTVAELSGGSGPSVAFNPDLPAMVANAGSIGSSLQDLGNSVADDLINAGSGAVTGLLDTANSAIPSAQFNPSSSTSGNADEPKATQPAQPFTVAKEQALQLASQTKLRDALELLSQYYESPDLGYAEHTDLVDIMDALSREVIYSNRHLLASPHTVSAQDTLESVASQYKLNPEFLASINGMGKSVALVPNTQIKVLEGPFHAQVSLSRGELTLFLRKLYAGRFPVSISQKNRPPQARYDIVDRRQDRTYYGGGNVRIPAGDPANPFGGFWLSLGSEYSIHGSPEQVTTDLEGAGCISLAPLDAADVYQILGKGSAVEIRP